MPLVLNPVFFNSRPAAFPSIAEDIVYVPPPVTAFGAPPATSPLNADEQLERYRQSQLHHASSFHSFQHQQELPASPYLRSMSGDEHGYVSAGTSFVSVGTPIRPHRNLLSPGGGGRGLVLSSDSDDDEEDLRMMQQ